VKSLSTAVCFAVLVGTTSWSVRADEKEAGDTGVVEGVVTLKGQPLPGGTIQFHPAKGKPIVAQIKDGAYKAKDVPVGNLAITVETESLNPAKAKDGAKLDAKNYVKIPEKYGNPETSGLRGEIKKGNQKLDVNLN
jgi:hypothetical protein